MRFRPRWDSYLIWLLEATREDMVHDVQGQGRENGDTLPSAKPVLTTYPLGYRLPNEVPDDIRPTLLVRIRCMLVLNLFSSSIIARLAGAEPLRRERHAAATRSGAVVTHAALRHTAPAVSAGRRGRRAVAALGVWLFFQ